ncbi:MAG: hypothetical protein GYA15_00695 [Leptolinea sp.]|nr:hypothetical protein [Leptolinea sp.]
MRYNILMKNGPRIEGENGFLGKIPVSGWIFLIVLLGITWKILWLVLNTFPFNADEAITGLMARHILQGERPIFFYGQAYMGSLDAFLTAGLFRLLGEGILPIRIVQMILYTCTIITTACLGQKLTGTWKAGLIAALLMAIPAVNVTLYTTVSLGGYGEALLISNGAFLCVMNLSPSDSTTRKSLLIGLLGLLAGLGFWVFGLTLVATLPAMAFCLAFLWRQREISGGSFFPGALILLAGFLIGSIPWWQAGLQSGLLRQMSELFGSAVAIEKGNWFIRTGNHLFYFLFFGLPAVFSFRPPWEIRLLGLPLLPFVLTGWGMAIWRFPLLLKKTALPYRWNWYMLIASAGALVAGFLFTSFGLDPSGRYFLPLAAPLYLMIASVILSSKLDWKWQSALIALLVVYHAAGTFQSATKNPPGITTQFDSVSWIDHRYDEPLMEFLRNQGETRGYTNYWVAYPLAFKSNEQIIFSPRLPYHADLRYTARDDRIPSYTRQVEESAHTAYITTFNPELDQALRKGFRRLGVTWEEKTIGDYHIYFRLNRAVYITEIADELMPILKEDNP